MRSLDQNKGIRFLSKILKIDIFRHIQHMIYHQNFMLCGTVIWNNIFLFVTK